MKIINNNIKTENHLVRMKELFSISDTILIMSPYLMTDFTDFFNEIDYEKLKHLHLITTVKPKSVDQIYKVSSLLTLIEFKAIKDKRINCKISINNRLHGKVYIFSKNDEYISAIVSSANFTGNGLSYNHEWGIEINDKIEILKLESSIVDNLDFNDLDFTQIYKWQQEVDEFLAKQPSTENTNIDLELIKSLQTSLSNDLVDTVNYWLKPVGYTESPVIEGRLFNSKEQILNFSKLRPSGVKPNDILIAYGVGTTKILSIYKIKSYPLFVTNDDIKKDPWKERWPWYVVCENLTENYGEKWWTFNLFITVLRDEYLKLYPNEPITFVGGQTLGGLNFGKDKLRLSVNFAKYMISKVLKLIIKH